MGNCAEWIGRRRNTMCWSPTRPAGGLLWRRSRMTRAGCGLYVLWTESNGGYLMFAPVCLAGLTVLLRGRAGGLSRVLWIDGLTTALSVGALRATLVFQQALSHESGQPVTVATALAYPPGDMILLAAVFGALARMGWRADRVWLLLGGEI